jgi:hypothetical protein
MSHTGGGRRTVKTSAIIRSPPEAVSAMDVTYEIRVQGLLGPMLRSAFADLQPETVTRQWTIRGQLSSEQLHYLLTRLDHCGIKLIRLRCQNNEPDATTPGRATRDAPVIPTG